MGAHAQAADNGPDFGLQGQRRRVVQMIPAIVGNQQVIYVRRVPWPKGALADKSPVQEKERGRVVAENRID
jgi:hypothetical protein